jgi:hypothetical protein
MFTTMQLSERPGHVWGIDEFHEYEHEYNGVSICLNWLTNHLQTRGKFTTTILVTYKQFIDFVDTETNHYFVTTPIIQHIISNVVTQFWRM